MNAAVAGLLGLILAVGVLFLLVVFVTWTAWHVVDGLNQQKARKAAEEQPPRPTP